MEYLDMKPHEALNHFNSTTISPVGNIIVRVAILRRSSRNPTKSEILLLKRTPSDTYDPNIYEMPGGRVSFHDESIREALEREVIEQTGLFIFRVESALQPRNVKSFQKIQNDFGGKSRETVRRYCQLSYVVRILGDEDEDDFEVDPGMHSTGGFFNEYSVLAIVIREDLRPLVWEFLESDPSLVELYERCLSSEERYKLMLS